MAYLESKHAHTSGTLRQNPVASLERPGLEAVQSIPCCDSGAAQGTRLVHVQIGGRMYQAMFVESRIFSEGTIQSTSETSREVCPLNCSCDMALIEQCHDLVCG